ncbi:hypothetical protein NMY22_g13978 [Coprinellus aureogranulatus]|nr:hypothetical protein NMY22_g13978 [Coprinellus aureogranulatus]
MTSYIPPVDVRKHRLRSVLNTVLKAQSPLMSPHATRTPQLLHWDSESGSLKLWAWWPCFTDGRRVPPDELEQHRREYYFRAPCCLCASTTDNTTLYAESTFQLLESVNPVHDIPRNRPFIGEYIAECATGTCGYFVLMERFYAKKTLLVKCYGKRAKPYDPNALAFLRQSEDVPNNKQSSCGFRRIFIGGETAAEFARGANKLKRCHEECSKAKDETSRALHSLAVEGVPEAQFWKLFVQCAQCGYVLPRHLYPYEHQCIKRVCQE